MSLLVMEVLLPRLYELDPLALFARLRCVCCQLRDQLPGVDMEYIGIWETCCRLRDLEDDPDTCGICRCFLDLRILLGWCEGSSAPGLRLLCVCAPIIDRLVVRHVGLSSRVLTEGAELVMELSSDVAGVGLSLSARHFELRAGLRRLLRGVLNRTQSFRLNLSTGIGDECHYFVSCLFSIEIHQQAVGFGYFLDGFKMVVLASALRFH